jgi:signal transduction histidine kinase/CheY-like chemotaxis protein/ligand-binding sensor domain-containing protein
MTGAWQRLLPTLVTGCLLVLSLPVPGWAQSYAIRSYSIDDGLPSPEVYGVAQDTRGRIWFTTRLGPTAYDGLSWKVYHRPVQSINSFISCDRLGSVWLAVSGTPGVDVSCFAGREWRVLEVDRELIGAWPRFTALATTERDGQTILAIGTQEHGVLLWRSETWTQVNLEQGMPQPLIRSIAGSGGRFFVAAGNSLYTISGDGRVDIALGELLPPEPGEILALALGQREPEQEGDPELWVLTSQSLLHLVDGAFAPVAEGLVVPAGEKHLLAVDPPYSAYFSHGTGLLRYDLIRHRIEEISIPRSKLGPSGMLVDRERNLWLTTPRGARKLVTLPFTNYTSADGLLEDEVTAVCEPRPGLLVFGHNLGLSLLEDGVFRHLPLPPASDPRQLIRRRVIDLSVDSRGDTWLAVNQVGLGRLSPGGRLTWFGKPPEVGEIYSVVEESPGKVLVGSSRLHLFDGRDFELISEWRKRGYGIVRRLLRERRGNILVVCRDGVRRWLEGRLQELQILPDEPGAHSCYTAVEDSQGRTWIGTQSGLLVVSGERLVRPDDQMLRFDDPVYLIAEDAGGALWFGTNRGVNRWDGVSLRHFGTREGFAGLETNRAAGLLDSRGRLWLGTESGVSLYQEELARPDRPAPLLELLEIRVGNELTALDAPIELAHNRNTIELHFRGISLSDEQVVRYRSRLEGFEPEWSEELPAQPRLARYTNLSPGTYTFHIKAANTDGVWSETVSSPAIVILQPFWKRWWFIALSVLAAFAIAAIGALTAARWRYAARLEDEVTQRRRAEIALREARDAAEAGNRAKSQFLANMSHEIRTPMHAVIGLSSLLTETDLTLEQRAHLDTISESAESLLVIINDILDFSKIDAGRLELETVDFDLDSVLQRTCQALEVQARNKNLSLDLEISPEVPLQLQGDPGRLRQILTNLITNAIKFTVRGRVLLQVTQEPGAQDPVTALLRFAVTDTGIGIPAAKRETLFDPFYQVDASTTREYGGTGLGLAIAKQLVEAMGGRIGVDSIEGSGSTFWFFLLLQRQAQSDGAEVPVDSPEPDPDPGEPARVLVVEDNLVNQKLARLLLERMGHRVTVAGNGLEALRVLESDSFDLVLMDVQMPVLDGLEATRRIRSRSSTASNPDVPIIAMTAFAMKYDRDLCLAAGMDDYMTKPVHPSELQRVVSRWQSRPGTSSGKSS